MKFIQEKSFFERGHIIIIGLKFRVILIWRGGVQNRTTEEIIFEIQRGRLSWKKIHSLFIHSNRLQGTKVELK